MITKTNNISFNKMRKVLQSAYVENNEFMMVTNHEELKDFDLSIFFKETRKNRTDLVNLIADECSENVWFFFRELVPAITDNIDDELYDLSEMGRYRLNVLSMIMIYLYTQNKNFVAQQFVVGNVKDRRIGAIAEETLSLLALYEYLFKSTEPGRILVADNEKTTPAWDTIARYYNELLSIASKGIIDIRDIICTYENRSSIQSEDFRKFYMIDFNTDEGSIEILQEVLSGKYKFFGTAPHIYDYPDILINALNSPRLEYHDDLKYILQDFINNTFSFRYIKSGYLNGLSPKLTDKYHFDRIFDHQGPLPSNENSIVVL